MSKLDCLKTLLSNMPDLELGVLVGSQSLGTSSPQSDWDIAVRWKKHINGWASLEYAETLKQQIAETIKIHKDQIDLIDMTSARLTMRAVIAEEGIVLKGEETLAWSHFLSQTWGELEDYYWRQKHAA